MVVVPVYALPLCNGWFLVVCNGGERFYYDKNTGESSMELRDGESVQLLEAVGSEKLVLLVGVARGYRYYGAESLYDSIRQDLDALRSESNAAGLINGYSSSSDDEESVMAPDDKQTFTTLFEKYHLDPYSTWSIQARKLQNAPQFYLLRDDAVKEELFEQWCISKTSLSIQELSDSFSEDSDSDGDDDDEDHLEPMKYHYLSHIVNKSSITSDTISLDIKKQNKQLFKKYKIKNFVPDKKDQETFIGKLLFYYKKFDETQRVQIFLELLNENKLIIQNHIPEFKMLALTTNIDDDSYAIETQLLKMENAIGIHKELQKLQTDPRYYVIGIKLKKDELQKFLANLAN